MLMDPDVTIQESPRLAYPGLDNLNRKPQSGSPLMGTSRLAEGIESKTLEFDVDVADAVFNKPGRYFVKMTIQSLFTKNYSKVSVGVVLSLISRIKFISKCADYSESKAFLVSCNY